MAAVVRTERHDAVLVVTLDDPAHRNAYDGEALHSLGRAWAELDADPELRVGVLTGAGGTFCAGADVAAAATGGFGEGPYPELAEPVASKPVLAAIEGHCLGGGFMLACGCDLRVAGETALLGLPEVRWNLPSHWLGALARQVLPAHALELTLLGDEPLPASRLLEMGWLNRIVPEGGALDEAMLLAGRIAALAPRAVRHSKELVGRGTWDDPASVLRRGHEQAVELVGMDDTAEGARAFAERRDPVWRDE